MRAFEPRVTQSAESKCNAIPCRIVSCRVTTPRQQRKQACREGHNEAVGHHYCACARKRAARRAKGARLCLSQAEIQRENLRPGSITGSPPCFISSFGPRFGGSAFRALRRARARRGHSVAAPTRCRRASRCVSRLLPKRLGATLRSTRAALPLVPLRNRAATAKKGPLAFVRERSVV